MQNKDLAIVCLVIAVVWLIGNQNQNQPKIIKVVEAESIIEELDPQRFCSLEMVQCADEEIKEPQEAKIETEEWIQGEFTAYNPVEAQCDDTPRITASQKQIKEGMIACPSKYEFGTKIEVEGLGVYVCEDRMNIRYDCFRQDGGCEVEKFYFDIILEDHQQAINFGRQLINFKVII